MLNFNFLSPQKVVFGWGRVDEIGSLTRELGRRVFLVDGSRTLRSSAAWTRIMDAFAATEIHVEEITTISREPTIADVDLATEQVMKRHPRSGDVVIGIGGGAAMDLAKAVAAMATNSRGRSVREFLEGVGTGAELTEEPLPMIAIPTTAGTGSEATKNAVVSVDEPPCKKSLRSERMVPNVALIDPELTVSVSRNVTAAAGMDAITQLIESYISKRAQPIPRALCLEGLSKAIPAIRTACDQPEDQSAREAMSYAAYLSGVSLANSGLGMAHGVAAALGAICNVSHGLACAALLPIAMRVNMDVAIEDLATVGRLFGAAETDSIQQAALHGIEMVERLCEDLQIPKQLRNLGVQRDQLPLLVSGSRGNSMNGNPVQLSDEQLMETLESNW